MRSTSTFGRLVAAAVLVLVIGCGRKSTTTDETAPAPSPSTGVDTTASIPPDPDRMAGVDSLSRAHDLIAALELQALGNEPFWSVGITRHGIVYRTPERPAGVRFPYSPPQVDGPRLIFTGSLPDSTPHAIRVVIQERECSDGMSDRVYRFGAEVRLDEVELRGCARYRPQPAEP